MPYTASELESAAAIFRAPPSQQLVPAAEEAPELKLPADGRLSTLLTPPELLGELVELCGFLASFCHQLGLDPALASLPYLDRAFSSPSFTSSVAIQLHLALMRFSMPESPLGGGRVASATRALIANLTDAWVLSWQEVLASYILWLDLEDPMAAEVVRGLRAMEYHQIAPGARLFAARVLCDRAVEQEETRAAVERRAEWVQAQPWSWDGAVALGRVQHKYEPCQLVRCEPIGSDRHGRLYLLLQGTLWIMHEEECTGLRGLGPIRKLATALGKAKLETEKRLHFTLSRMITDGAFAKGSADDDEDAGDEAWEMPLPAPKYDKVPSSGAVSCGVSGKPNRVFVLDMLRHTHAFIADRCHDSESAF